MAPDRLSATFRIRPEARFHNGDPVLAADVKHSFDTLIGKLRGAAASRPSTPKWRAASDRRSARCASTSRAQPRAAAGRRRHAGVQPRTGADGKAKPFDQVIIDMPIASGPYKIGPVRFGKRHHLRARSRLLGARPAGAHAACTTSTASPIKIYKDNTARLEALKAGEFDMMSFYSAATGRAEYNGKQFDSGELVKQAFAHKLPAGFQGYVLNTAPASSRTSACAGDRAGAGLRVAEPPVVLRQLHARARPVPQHRLRRHGLALARELALLEPCAARCPARCSAR